MSLPIEVDVAKLLLRLAAGVAASMDKPVRLRLRMSGGAVVRGERGRGREERDARLADGGVP